MLHLYLPDLTLRNQEFALKFAKKFRKIGLNGYARHWQAWQGPGAFDLGTEVTLTEKVIKPLGRSSIGIIAKSIGNLVATELELSKAKLDYLVLMGLPHKSMSTSEISGWVNFLRSTACPIYLIQNRLDPEGSGEGLLDLLTDNKFNFHIQENASIDTPSTKNTGYPNITVILPDRSDHVYEDLELLVKIASSFDNMDQLAV